MPALSGTQSPLLKSFFTRRDLEPLYVAIPSRIEDGEEDNEKTTPPVIILTPSTPTDADYAPVYPAGRLPPPQHYYLDEVIEDATLKPVSRWPWQYSSKCLASSRTARVAGLMAVVGLIVLVHFVVMRTLADNELQEAK